MPTKEEELENRIKRLENVLLHLAFLSSECAENISSADVQQALKKEKIIN